MSSRKILVGVIIVFSTMLSSFAFYFFQVLYSANFQVEGEARPLMIRTGSTFKDVQNLVYDKRYVNDLLSFSFLAKLMDYDQYVKPGLYLIEPDMGNLDVVRLLRSGEQTPVNITFNSIRLLEELPEKITKNLEMEASDFANALSNDSLRTAYGFDSLNYISMFIPNTYQVYWNIKPAELIKRMNAEYMRFWNASRTQMAESIGLTQEEVLVLSSIVEAEVSKSEESKRVAGVYMNRLKRNIPLQADPTLIFAARDFTIKRVLNKHKRTNSPYNTYKYTGLPPGPINMPSVTTIDAVLNYEQHKFLYFCAKEDFSGYHNFATNLRDHKKNADRYQAALNRAGLFR